MSAPHLAPGRRIVVRRRPRIILPEVPVVQPFAVAPSALPPAPDIVDPGSLVARLDRLVTALEAQGRPASLPSAAIFTHPSSPIAYVTSPFDVDLLAAGRLRRPPNEVLLLNEGPAALHVTLGGHTYPLAPWDRHIFPCNGGASLHVEPVLLTSPLPAAPSSSLLVAIAPQGSAFPGLPTAASRQTSAYAALQALKVNSADSGIYTAQPNTVRSNVVYPFPTGTLSVRSEINQLNASAKWTGYTLVGNVTGKQYNVGTSNSSGVGGFDETFQIDPEDTSLLLSIDTTGSANPVSYWLTASAAATFSFVHLTGPGTAGQPIIVNNQTAAPWQAASLFKYVERTSAGQTQLISGVVGQTIRVHALYLMSDGGASTQAGIEETGANAPTSPGNRLLVSPVSTAGAWGGPGGGASLGGGDGLQLNAYNVAGSSAVRASVFYNQS